GVNHYPQDLERTAQECEADLKAGAAFAVDGDAGEALVLVQEVGRHPRLPLPELARRIAAALAEAHGVAATVALVPQGHVPKTSSGKLQRRACRQSWLDGRLDLLARWPEAAPQAAPQEAAGGDARAWALQRLRELGARAPEAGWDAPLAAWGLDSLRVTQFLAELQRRSGQKQALPEPADEPLGLLLSSFSAAPRLALAKSPAAPARRWPAHASMAGLWAAQQMAPGSSAYHIAWSLRLRGRPDAGRLQRALDALARQQASLRCAFEQDADGGLWQVDQGHGAALERPWSGPGPADQAQAWSQGWNQRPFDTSRAPLWRAALLPLDDGSSLLAFSFHHLIFDQRSLEALYLGLEAAYLRPEAADEPGFPAPHWPGQEALRAVSTAYWRERLRGLQAWPLPPIPGVEPASLTLKAELGPGDLAALRRLAVAERCTPFTVAACAWAEALAEAGGREEACFATPFTLRDQPLSDRQIGYWVHPLPLRLNGRADQDPRGRLRQAAAAVREAMGHRGLSLAEALRCANAPFPEAFLVYQGELELPEAWLGFPASLSPIANAGLKAALALEISGEKAWALSLEYDPARLPTSKATGLLQSFVRAARRMAASAQPAPAALVRGEAVPAGGQDSVLDLFRGRVQRDPSAAALLWKDGSWDYATLARKAQSVARALEARGLQRGDAVGVCSPAGPAWAAAVLGCFEAGAVYVPLDPAYPSERLRHMHAAAGCRVVLGQGARPSFVEAADWLGLDEAMDTAPSTPGRPPRGQEPAYVIFTSGSSGRPKGVQVGHAALANHARGYARRLGLAPGDRVLQFVSISFDPSLEELLPALCSGAALVLPQRLGAPGVEELADWARRLAVTVLHLPVAYWHAFMQAGGGKELAKAADLRAVVVGGEAPDPRWVEALGAALGNRASFFNAYGPTEACISATLWEWRCASPFDGLVPLGSPLPGVDLALVDGQGRLAAPGAEGELWISGAALAHGYLGGLDEGRRFVEADLDGQGTRRYYRSGDRAQVDAQGRLFYRGRADRQVKAAGVRLDLEEIEGLLAQADGALAAAICAEGSGESLRLRAWVVPQAGRTLDAEGLRAWLSRHLPAAALPTIEICDNLPLTPNGKLDRRSLALAAPGPAPRPTLAAPAAAGLAQCCQAFALALGLPSVDPDTDFFAAGGSSLRAVRLAAEAGRLLERNVMVEQVYQASTPRALAGLLFGAPARASEPLRPLAGQAGLDWVLLPPVSGRLECYQGLAAALGAQARVWGLDLELLPPPRADGWLDWVGACATILRQGLEGRPLVLGGWSMGGLLAADLAQALLDQGVEVRRLVLIDAVLPDPLHSALLRSDDQVLDELVERDLPAAAGGATDAGRERYKQHARALGSFRARSLNLPLSLVVSERTANEQPRLGWMTWALMARKGMTTLMVSGDHFSVLGNTSLPRMARRLLEDTASPAVGAGGQAMNHQEGRHAYETA
ncbi:MAG TPA: amino acid adenylation domain-containing protein, partial [bacterium]|nr:amino acid adenylation domain-containing protein [bacterium]